MEFSILDLSVSSVCNMVSLLFLDRFKDMEFSKEKLHNFIEKVAYSY